MKLYYIFGFVGFAGILSLFLLQVHQNRSPVSPIPVSQPKQSYRPHLPNLESIFADDHTWIATLSASHIITMTATGDIIPARSVNFGTVRHKSPLWPYEKVTDVFKKHPSDITFINLESPLIASCPLTDEGMIFCGNTNNVSGLTSIGVSIANLANNHLGNYRLEGITSTKNLLTQAGIAYTGINGPTFIHVKGKTIAFLGYNDIGAKEAGISWAEENNIAGEVTDAKKHADLVIVAFHWGTEYKIQPDPMQVTLGHLAIDNGADVVIGNHPHWIQPVELYKGKLITYAHGNFVFDQMWSLKTRQGVVGRYTFYDMKLIDVEFSPVQIQDYGQPYFLTDVRKKEILTDMKSQSIILAHTSFP